MGPVARLLGKEAKQTDVTRMLHMRMRHLAARVAHGRGVLVSTFRVQVAAAQLWQDPIPAGGLIGAAEVSELKAQVRPRQHHHHHHHCSDTTTTVANEALALCWQLLACGVPIRQLVPPARLHPTPSYDIRALPTVPIAARYVTLM